MASEHGAAYGAELAARVCSALKAAQPDTLSLEELGKRFHHSPTHLQRLFKRATGITPKQYAADLRLTSFKARLRDGDGVTDAIHAAGYGSSSRLYDQSDSRLGMTPTAYKHRGVGMTIVFDVAPCPLGQLLLAATERGICKLSLGDCADSLIADLQHEFSAAGLIRDDAVAHYAAKVVGWLHEADGHLHLPLDIRATAFQLKVWRALQAIPIGETRSYSQVASAIGQPKAFRAVANACANNPVALVIPCHRVLRQDGSLGGYRWGMARKQALLDSEKR